MKGKKFYLILIGVIAVGIGSLFIYRQQKEARALEFEGYEILAIEKRVDALYNENKTDIEKSIESEIIGLKQMFLELENKDLKDRSKKRIEKIEEEFSTAQEMHELQEDILNIFEENKIVHKNTTRELIKELQSLLIAFEEKTIYYNRNKADLKEATVQIETIEKATKLVEQLNLDELTKENIEALDDSELEKIKEAINQIKNEEIKLELTKQLESIQVALNEHNLNESEVNEEELLEEAIIDEDLEDELENEETVEIAQETTQSTEQTGTRGDQQNNRPSDSQSQTSNTNSGNTSNQGNKQPDVSEENLTNKPEAVKVKTEEIVFEELPYSTVTSEVDYLDTGTEKVDRPGTPGQRKIIYEVTVNPNGTSTKKLISDSVVTEPVDELVVVGTRENESNENTPPSDTDSGESNE